MKVLGICCSPRRGGNTEIMVQEALNSAREWGAEVEFVTLAGKTIMFCDGCDSCKKTHKCHLQDDMQPIYAKLLEADGIIFGAPVYIWTINAQAKALMDRTYCLGHGGLRDKVAAAITVAGRAGDISAFTVFAGFFNIQRMVSAGVAMGFGLDKGDVRKDERGMAEARALGRVVVRYIKRYARADLTDAVETRMPMPPRTTVQVPELADEKRG